MNALLQRLVDGLPPASPLAPPPRPQIQKVSYNHEAMIDMLIADPWISQNEIARRFGMSASWISTIICSDLFQARLAERREKLVDPQVRVSLKTQFEGLLSRSMEILRCKLDAEPEEVPDRLAVEVAKMAGKNLGMQAAPTVSIQETHVHLEELGQNLVKLMRKTRGETYEADHEGHPQLGEGQGAGLLPSPPLGRQLPAAHLGLLPTREAAGVHEPELPGAAAPAHSE